VATSNIFVYQRPGMPKVWKNSMIWQVDCPVGRSAMAGDRGGIDDYEDAMTERLLGIAADVLRCR